MASITQTIPSYTAGISQQPDEMKIPGQVNIAKNVMPDVTYGLMKRPGSRLVKSLSDDSTSANNSVANGRWFSYYRDEVEQYIGQIAQDGTTRIWRCSDGAPMTIAYQGVRQIDVTNAGSGYTSAPTVSIANASGSPGSGAEATATIASGRVISVTITKPGKNYSNGITISFSGGGGSSAAADGFVYSGTETALETYLTHTADAQLQTLTLNDYTYVTNRNKITAMSSTVETARPAEIFIDLKKISYSSQYAVNLYDSEDLDTVTTATRIQVTRRIDTNNACKIGLGGDGSGKGIYHPDGTMPTASNAGDRCDEATNPKRDSLCPNVDTRIFSIDDAYSGDSDDANGASWSVNVQDSGNNDVSADSTRQNATGPCKNLYFRIATIGQAVPTDGSSPTYYCRYTTTHDLLYGGEGWKTGDYFYVWMKDAEYKVTIMEHSESKVQASMNSTRRSGLIRPEPTPFDSETTITAESILGSIRGDIVSLGNGLVDSECKQIGTGLYVTNGSDFNGTTPVGDLIEVVSGEVNDPEDLPQQCKHQYVVKVKNSSSDEDDYYVKFFGDNDKDGKGVWEECAQPERKIEFDKTTMPIQIVRQADNTFQVAQIEWENAQVGDPTTNPEPSFVGKSINKMVFFRNRFCMLSDENVIMSRPGDFYNFWNKTAMTFSNTDPIDLSCSSTYPAVIYDAIPVNAGLILFTKNQQFMLTTDSDILNPTTAKINSLSSYNFNHNTNPVSLGTTVGFLDNAGKYSRFFEMAKILREGEPEVVEQSKIVTRLFDNDLNLISGSRENSVIFFSEKNSDTLYVFKYYNATEKRLQQSWFTWKVCGDVQYHCMLDDALFAVVKMNGKDILQRFDIKREDDSRLITDDKDTTSVDDDLLYRVHLDNSTLIDDSAVSAYDSTNDRTTFSLPSSGFPYTATQLDDKGIGIGVYVYEDAADDTFQGMTVQATLSGTTVQLPGNWKTYVDDKGTATLSDDTVETPSYKIILGYLFDMEVEFPTIYVTRQEGESFRSDTRSSLVLHRVKLNLGDSGLYETTLQRTGKDDYTEVYEPIVADAYSANQIQFTSESIKTVPIYDRNTNTTLTLKSTHASPATLQSMTWEGDYNTKFYNRV